MEVVVLTAVIEMTPDSYSVKFIFPGFLGSSIYPLPVILGAVKTCDTPPSPANGEEREAVCSGSADDDEEDEDDERLQGNGTLAVSDRGFHCCASSSVWPS